MTEFESRLHRTWVQALLEAGQRELAAAVLDADLTVLVSGFSPYGLSIDLPPSSFSLVRTNARHKEVLVKTLKEVAAGHISDQNEGPVDDPHVELRMKLLDPEEGWQAVVRDLIVNFKDTNQGLISEKAFKREGRSLLAYNEMKFASQGRLPKE